MLKVIITDDEIQILKGLKMKVDWEQEGFQIVGEALNGQETLDFLQTKEIDIVITDIRMPVMDGMELAKRCHEDYPDIKVIVLSGYSEFEYVRHSMQEGVKDYILKPVDPDELLETLRKVRMEIEEEKRKEKETARIRWVANSRIQEVQEQYILHIATGELLEFHMIQDRLLQLQLDHLANDDINVIFLTVEVREGNEDISYLKSRWLPFQMLCKELATYYPGTYYFNNPSYRNLVHFMQIIEPEQENLVTHFIRDFQIKVKTLLKLETVIGVGSVVTGLVNFKSGYISSLYSWGQSKLGPMSQVIDEKQLQKEVLQISEDIEKKLTIAIEGLDIEMFKSTLESVTGVENQSIFSFYFVANRVLILVSSFTKKYDIETREIQKTIWDCQQSISGLDAPQKVIAYLVELALIIIEKIRLTRFSNGKIMIDSIQHYLDVHYANEISLTLLSKTFHINSSYLSEIFKSHVGQNFSEYLVELRMKKAKKFLEDRELKVIDVANLVGFLSSGYFSTVFKKQFGQTPVEYRDQLIK
ncbi:response regulator transcription factor [Lederbergia panacisoli]|uniref:response regulator transcription factor n=1 Tax=Lederbergia panacisoli TaxID=1255251 RepID=UPI00214C2E87|nr:response regulator [Lederbergia panacisoli]MCR2823043.1 response regulator [Lederbergia panacisoli]